MELFWHRRDLRVHDNVGLAAASKRGPVLPTFVLDDDVLEHASPVRVRFLLDALEDLRSAYRDCGSDLLVLYGDPAEMLSAVATSSEATSSEATSSEETSSEATSSGVTSSEGTSPEVTLDVDRVVWNHDYSGLARRRDAHVRRRLDEAGIAHESHHDAVLHRPGAIKTNQGDPYSVYTYYWRKWTDREATEARPAPESDALVARTALRTAINSGKTPEDASLGDLPTVEELGFAEPDASLPEAGAEAARERLDSFLAADVYRYAESREFPAASATSRISQDLAYGTIGIREVYEATARALDAAGDRSPDDVSEADAVESVEGFQGQLAWREFYTQVLYHHPAVVTENYRTYEEPIDWRDDPEELAAWKAGETGYPIVDAGMRQLRAEAYVHNRVRMIVASFLTKDLLVDWRKGYAHFRDHLVDHDTANDNGGWQWAASTGTDAQPYFRIFNPMTQGERYDPDAAYIAVHVPELRGVDPVHVHAWHELSPVEREEVAPDYPAPIVDHSERRTAAIAMFERARGEVSE